MNPILHKFFNTTKGLSDAELDWAITLFSRLVKDLKELGPTFSMAQSILAIDLERFENIKMARELKLKKKWIGIC